MHEYALTARFVLGKLADGFKKRQCLDVTNRAADFAKHEIDFVFADQKKIFNFVGDMRDHLNGFAQIIAAAFFFQHIGINPARRNRIGVARGHTCETLVMAQIQIGFGTIVGHKHLAMFKR